MKTFHYHADILARYPDVVGGVLLAQDMTNGPTPESLLTSYQAEQEIVKKRISNTPLSQIESLAAWRGAFRKFGVDPTQCRSSPEALLRRLIKKGDIPSINLLVDIGNLISIRYALPVGIFDTRAIQGSITVHFADGTERYTTLGQSEQSAAQADTTNTLITVEAHHTDAQRDIKAALMDLQDLLQKYAGGTFEASILDAENPTIRAYNFI